MIVDEIEDADKLEMHAAKSVHIMLDTSFNSESGISELKNFLLDKTGNCSVYFHIDTGNNPYVIKANEQISLTTSDSTLKELRDISYVKQVWTE